jgi:aminoglycoside phosphotransferase (APT) family kinase protein
VNVASDERFAAVVATIAPGATVLSTQVFAGGLSSQMTVVAVALPDDTHRRFVVRTRRPPHYGLSIASEYALLVALHDLGLRVPVPRRLDESMTLLDDPYLVLDYVDAAPQVTADDPIAIARAFAAELAAIHRIDGSGAAFADLPRRTERIAEHLVDPPAELDASVGEGDIRETLRAHWPPSQPAHVSLLHGDFWPGNVLGSGDEIVAVIDWENACVGDPLVDLASTRLDLLFAFGPRPMATFTQHYVALTASDLSNLPLWDLVAALRPAGDISVWASDWRAFGRPDVTASAMRAAHAGFVDAACAALA